MKLKLANRVPALTIDQMPFANKAERDLSVFCNSLVHYELDVNASQVAKKISI